MTFSLSVEQQELRGTRSKQKNPQLISIYWKVIVTNPDTLCRVREREAELFPHCYSTVSPIALLFIKRIYFLFQRESSFGESYCCMKLAVLANATNQFLKRTMPPHICQTGILFPDIEEHSSAPISLWVAFHLYLFIRQMLFWAIS